MLFKKIGHGRGKGGKIKEEKKVDFFTLPVP